MPDDSTVKFKADISQLKAAMQQASRQVRLANSEFKAATAGLDDWSNSATGLNAKLKQLDDTLKAQKRQVELAKEQWEKTAKAYGENSAEADRAKIALNNYEAAVAKTEKQIDNYTKELKDCENGTGRFADETEDLDSVVRRASDGFTVMKGALASLVADGFRMAISAAKDFAKETLQAGMNFEQGMAQVAAVSGASEEELAALTEKAKEMGASTKFSATESAEAFNYMAMAGWKTEDMLNGIEGIMDLAAASGADLATTSDIVTDALTAMGYSAGDAGKLADVMAAASSNANTNVEMMGQTFQYAAPIIGALGMNMEDAAVAIGLMANAGIKGEKSGTALRSILTRLSAPPKECADAMEELGISLTDEAGNMKSLDEVMQDLRKAFADLDETQQTANAKAIAGQEAMSGLLAIVNAAPADYQKLTKAVEESEGAAQSMADTMNDTVAGQLTLLKSQIEGVQIQIFEKLEPALRTGIDKISEYISNVNWDKVGEALGKFAEKAINFFIKIIENGEGIIEVLKAVGKVLAVTFVVNKITAFATFIVGLVKTFKDLKTATEAATTAQKLLNLAQAATPIGMITAAVAGLAAGLLYFAGKSKEAAEATNNLTEAEQEQIDKIHEMADAYADVKASRDESVEAINAEFGKYQELANELDTLVDANGKVKEGYEDRAAFIVSTLNEALGTEMEMTDGIIQNYKEEKKAIEDLIETKKAQAILSANEEGYTQAIQNEKEALQQYTEASNLYNDKIKERNALQSEAQRLANMTVQEYAALNGFGHNYEDAAYAMTKAQEGLNQSLAEADRGVYEARQAYQEAEDTYIGYQNTIKNYEGLSAAIISGDVSKINQALDNMVNDFISADGATKRTLENQVKNAEANYEALRQAVEDGSEVVTQEMVDNAKDMVDKAVAELNKFEEQGGEAGEKGGQATADGLRSKTDEVGQAASDLRKTADDNIKDDGSSEKAGINFGQGYWNGIHSMFKSVSDEARGLSTNAVEALDSGQDSHSPSAKTTTSGENFGQGFINGMDNKESSIWKKAFNLAKTAINALKQGQQEGSPSKLTFKSGVFFVQGYINGIVSQQKKLQKTVKNTVSVVIKELAKMSNYNFDEVAQNASTKFADTINQNLSYMLAKMQYQNEQKLKEFDTKIAKLQKQQQAEEEKIQANKDKNLVKKLSAENKAKYEKLINTQKKYKEAYQKASQQMITEFSSAMQDYKQKAQALIDDTINGITEKYDQRYNDLLTKQSSLIDKLKNAGDLFEISGAGVITVNDLKEQTKAINDYTKKLQKIKSKVSSELFDQIASYDMTEGSAFMDQLLAMSTKDLEAYNKAYTEKMEAAQKAGNKIYKKDFSQLAKDYKAEIKTAFKGLDKQLEDMGTKAMKSFISGLTKNTDYMSKEIKTFVKSITSTFKEELSTKNVAMAKSIGSSTPLIGALSEAKARVGSSVNSGIHGTSESSVTNNYNLIQNNTSPKSLSALETYQARRQQIAMVKAMT